MKTLAVATFKYPALSPIQGQGTKHFLVYFDIFQLCGFCASFNIFRCTYIHWLIFFSVRVSHTAITHATLQSSVREGLDTVEQNHTSTDTCVTCVK